MAEFPYQYQFYITISNFIDGIGKWIIIKCLREYSTTSLIKYTVSKVSPSQMIEIIMDVIN